MAERNRTPYRRIKDIPEANQPRESDKVGEGNFESQIINRRKASTDVDNIVNAIVAPVSGQAEVLFHHSRISAQKVPLIRVNRTRRLNYQCLCVDFSTS